MAVNASGKQEPQVTNPRILNAGVRFNNERAARLTSAQLAEKTDRNKNTNAVNDANFDTANDPYYDAGENTSSSQGNRSELLRDTLRKRRMFADIQDMFKKADEYITADELKQIETLKIRKYDEVGFPFFMVGLAVLKDVLDFSDFTLIGIVFTTVLSLFISGILFFWIMQRMRGGWWKKKLIKKILIKYGITITLEFIPLFKIVPATTIFVLLAHYDQTKYVGLINSALDRMRGKF